MTDLLHQEPVNLCDPRAGPVVLGAVISQRARRYAPGVRVYYHRGMWMHQESGVIYVDSPTMDYRAAIQS